MSWSNRKAMPSTINQIALEALKNARKRLWGRPLTHLVLLLMALMPARGILAQPVESGAGSLQIDRWTGLYDTDNAATIPDTACQDCLNVETNLSGNALQKRGGFQRVGSLTVTTSPVTGAAQFTSVSGANITVVCHDVYCSKSANEATFSAFLATATSGVTYWTFAAVDGSLYMANDKHDRVGIYDGTTLVYSTTIPQGSLVELADTRLVVADITATLMRVWYSKAGYLTEFNTGTNSSDAFWDDLTAPGSRITALKFYNGLLYVFKDRSLTVCEVNDQYTTRCGVVSDKIGTVDPLSLVPTSQGLLFKANDGHYWRTKGSAPEPISRQIANVIANMNSGKSRLDTQTTKAQWEAGTQTPADSWDMTTHSGSIFPSSVTFTETSGADFSGGTLVNLSTTDVSDALMLSSSVVQDGFGDGNYTANPTWTITAGTWDASGGKLVATYWTVNTTENTIWTESDKSSGSWSFVQSFVDGSGYNQNSPFEYRFIKDASDNYYSIYVIGDDYMNHPKSLYLRKYFGGTGTNLITYSAMYLPGVSYSFQIIRSTAGLFTWFIDGVQISTVVDTSINTSAKTEISVGLSRSGGNYRYDYFDNIYTSQYYSSGTYTSKIFDTAFTTPTWGTFNADLSSTSVASQQKITFQVRASTDPDDTFESWVDQTNQEKAGAKQGRYVQYRAVFETEIPTMTPRMNSIDLPAATTGQYTMQCITPASAISSWGIFTCAETKTGAGALSYYARSNLGCSYLSTTSWTAQANNTTLTVATGTAIQLRWDSLLGSATDQAQVDACTVYWNEGTPAQPIWGMANADESAVYWTATTTAATQGNRLLKYDYMGNWWPMDIRATALLAKSDGIYFGSSAGGYWNKYAPPGVHSDNGEAINAWWIGRDFGMGKPFQEKKLTAVSIVAKNEGSGNLNAEAQFRNGTTKSWTISLSTITANQIRSNYAFPLASPDTFMRLKLSNDAANEPFSVLGLRLDYWLYPWRVLGP